LKQDIHPKYYSDSKVVCSCGKTYTIGSTKEEMRIELCGSCHPFYTGEQKIVDTEGRVERLKRRYNLS
jgi:large subunit ribosomal protein L31|tara:strand:- start:2098 stop:2301 length:204 start_codon:yes stop_codon:yes gene_type:complete